MTGRLRTALSYVVLAVFTVFAAFPFVVSVLTSLKPAKDAFTPGLPAPPTLANYSEVVHGTPLFLTWVVNSVIVAAVAVALIVLFAMMGGYALARIPFPGSRWLLLVMLGTMMVPGQVLWIPNYATCTKLGWVNTWWGLIPDVVTTLTSGIFLVSQFLKGMPKELEEAAILDGLSRFGLFWRIILPLAGPVLASMTITSFMATWNNFAWPVIILNSPERFTLPIGLNFFKGVFTTRWTLVMAASMFNTVPVLVVFILFQRYFVKGIATAGMKV
jgi:multiple sugar transport system permease protein